MAVRRNRRRPWPCGLVAGAAFALHLALVPGRSLAQTAPHHPVTLAILYPLGTNQNPEVTTTAELSFCYGRVGALRGLALNGVASVVGHDVRGVQLTGVYSQVGGSVGGVQLTGVANYVRSEVRGLQMAGLANIDLGNVTGVQYGGLFNLVEGAFVGVQLASLMNIVETDFGTFQVSGLANAAGHDVHGLQLAGGYNFAGNELAGIQIGGVNMALEMYGAQIGIANFGRTAHGLQVGALNRVSEQKGVPVGLVNLAENAEVDWVSYGSNLTAVNTGVRTTVRRFYSMLTAGTPDLQGDVADALVLTWNYGYLVGAGPIWSFGVDAGFAHYIPALSDDPGENDRLHWGLQARALAERRLSPKVRAFAGGGVSRIYSEYRLDAPGETEPLFFGGVSLY